MVYEAQIFNLGLWVGYFVCFSAFMLGSLIGYIILTARHEKFLREHKLFQTYMDWEHKNKNVFRIVRKK